MYMSMRNLHIQTEQSDSVKYQFVLLQYSDIPFLLQFQPVINTINTTLP